MNIEKYVERIKYQGKLNLNEKCLKELHRNHVMAIPFEAIDIQLKRPISLKEKDIYNKVIDNNRGGYCYELNLLFHKFLSKIGFSNHLISAKIYDSGKFGPEYDHMAILLQLDDTWLVDVGYGDLFIEPLKLIPDFQQEDTNKIYKIEKQNSNEYLLTESQKDHLDFRIKYKFNTTPKKSKEFYDQNNWKQSSKESYFVKNTVCTIPTLSGRKTIFNNTYKSKNNNLVKEHLIQDEKELHEILENEFKLNIENLLQQ